MKSIFNNQRLVSLTPLVTAVIFETANIGQIIEMWRKRSAEGQSVFSWCIITLALMLWYNFYRVKTPDEKIAIYMTGVAIIMNWIVIGTVIYFKFFA